MCSRRQTQPSRDLPQPPFCFERVLCIHFPSCMTPAPPPSLSSERHRRTAQSLRRQSGRRVHIMNAGDGSGEMVFLNIEQSTSDLNAAAKRNAKHGQCHTEIWMSGILSLTGRAAALPLRLPSILWQALHQGSFLLESLQATTWRNPGTSKEEGEGCISLVTFSEPWRCSM